MMILKITKTNAAGTPTLSHFFYETRTISQFHFLCPQYPTNSISRPFKSGSNLNSGYVKFRSATNHMCPTPQDDRLGKELDGWSERTRDHSRLYFFLCSLRRRRDPARSVLAASQLDLRGRLQSTDRQNTRRPDMSRFQNRELAPAVQQKAL